MVYALVAAVVALGLSQRRSKVQEKAVAVAYVMWCVLCSMYVCVCVHNICMNIYVYMYMHVYLLLRPMFCVCFLSLGRYLCVCIYIYMCVCRYVRVYVCDVQRTMFYVFVPRGFGICSYLYAFLLVCKRSGDMFVSMFMFMFLCICTCKCKFMDTLANT